MKTVVGGLLIMLAAATSHGANGAFTLQEENDVFAANHRTDHAYTNGARFLWDWTADRGSMQFLARNARRLCHTTLCETRLTLGVGQTMYTPQNLKATRPIAGDRPYGGWFFGVVMADALEQSTIDHVELYAGIIGPHAYSKTTQTAVHRAIHAQKPMGWANQISDGRACSRFMSGAFMRSIGNTSTSRPWSVAPRGAFSTISPEVERRESVSIFLLDSFGPSRRLHRCIVSPPLRRHRGMRFSSRRSTLASSPTTSFSTLPTPHTASVGNRSSMTASTAPACVTVMCA